MQRRMFSFQNRFWIRFEMLSALKIGKDLSFGEAIPFLQVEESPHGTHLYACVYALCTYMYVWIPRILIATL